MLGGGFIETAISLALMYLMISLLCTIVVELGASFLRLRSQQLFQALTSLLYVDPAEQAKLKVRLNNLLANPPANLQPQQIARQKDLVNHFASRELFTRFADHPLIGKNPDVPKPGLKTKYLFKRSPPFIGK